MTYRRGTNAKNFLGYLHLNTYTNGICQGFLTDNIEMSYTIMIPTCPELGPNKG